MLRKYGPQSENRKTLYRYDGLYAVTNVWNLKGELCDIDKQSTWMFIQNQPKNTLTFGLTRIETACRISNEKLRELAPNKEDHLETDESRKKGMAGTMQEEKRR